MLDNLENVLKILFGKVSPEMALQGEIQAENIREREFVRIMRGYEHRYSDTELSNLYDYLTRNFEERFGTLERDGDSGQPLNVFRLLFWYSMELLRIENNEILCEYKWFLHWRMSTLSLSEDLFIAAFLAGRNAGRNMPNVSFNWKPVITHNNAQLHRILERGMSENHYHLKGSAPVFQLTWISIMNDISDASFWKSFQSISRERRSFRVQQGAGYQERELSLQVLQAALIRAHLCWIYLEEEGRIPSGCLKKEPVDLMDVRNLFYYLRNPLELMLVKDTLEKMFWVIGRAGRQDLLSELPDYALNGIPIREFRAEDETTIYQGERWFLYTSFRYIKDRFRKREYAANLLYAYILIKETIRSEIVQNNNYVGFENFSIYQDRKDIFLESPFYRKALVREAVQNTLLSGKVMTLEARIVPKDTAEKLAEQIRELDQFIAREPSWKDRFFYTVHFIKCTEKITKRPVTLSCRNIKVRQSVEKRARALAEMREKYPWYAKRIRGIDAASQEILCRPEVFAQAYRFLADHVRHGDRIFGTELPQLRMTYHAGEDFFDVVSGLRAIDEALSFLNLTCGSRLGHALALGISTDEWYASKNNRILLPQQEYLDNVVWLYHALTIFHIEDVSPVKEYLKKEYDYYFRLIYGNAMREEELSFFCSRAREYYKGTAQEKYYRDIKLDFNLETYYDAWCLRGDAPDLYREGYFKKPHAIDSIRGTYPFYGVNSKFPAEKKDIRFFQENAILNYYYHFNWDVRYEGEKRIEIKTSPLYREAVARVQKALQRKTADFGVAVETNPSSNYLIGTFKRYDKHPILQFYNQNLNSDEEKLNECPQFSVSINTDDIGVFSVSLENEYAYMALALEKARDEKRRPVYNRNRIYQWLDDIRRMGVEQTFLSSEEMIKARKTWEGQQIKDRGAAGKARSTAQLPLENHPLVW